MLVTTLSSFLDILQPSPFLLSFLHPSLPIKWQLCSGLDNLDFALGLNLLFQLGSLIGPLSPKHSISSLAVCGQGAIDLSNFVIPLGMKSSLDFLQPLQPFAIPPAFQPCLTIAQIFPELISSLSYLAKASYSPPCSITLTPPTTSRTPRTGC